jgi:hypothetical protein
MQEDAILTYPASNMVLAIHSNNHTYPNQNLAVTWVDTCVWLERKTYLSTMAPSSISCK